MPQPQGCGDVLVYKSCRTCDSSFFWTGRASSVAHAGTDEFHAGVGLTLVWMSCRCREPPGLNKDRAGDDFLGPEFGLSGIDAGWGVAGSELGGLGL